MFVAQWCRAFGAAQVICVDTDPAKLDLARQLGLTTTLDGAAPGISDRIRELTGGHGADFAFEAAGAGVTLINAMHALAAGGTIGILGRPTKPVELPPEFFELLLRRQATIRGSWSFEFQRHPHLAWEESLAAVASGKILVDPLISHRIGLDDVLATVRTMSAGSHGITKAIVNPEA